jgi:4-amino-4-deoxychorismate lyase
MSLLLESIKLEDGVFFNLFYHEQRMNRALRLLCGTQEYIDLDRFLSQLERPQSGLYKCRIVYDDRSREVEFLPYVASEINTLRVVEHDRINYEFKYQDRRNINRLFDLRKNCDDVLIVKRGFVTDTSYCNIVFRKGKRWYTPWSALLKGTQRQKLLQLNMIMEEDIRVDDISSFESFKLINAMIEFNGPEIEVSNIIYS